MSELKKLWYVYTMEYHVAEKRTEFLHFVTAWLEVQTIVLSETSQLVKDKYHMISLNKR